MPTRKPETIARAAAVAVRRQDVRLTARRDPVLGARLLLAEVPDLDPAEAGRLVALLVRRP